MLFDSSAKTWSELVKHGLCMDPFWSSDGKYLYMDSDDGNHFSRLRISDRKSERLINVKGSTKGMLCWSMNLTPDNSFVIGFQTDTSEIYALGWDAT